MPRPAPQASRFPGASRSLKKWPAPASSQAPLEDVYVATDSPTPMTGEDGEVEPAAVTWWHPRARRTALLLRLAAAEGYLTADSPEARPRRPGEIGRAAG